MAPGKFKFNINPNTLSADYELWVCGSVAIYYLMPVAFIRDIYEHPNSYIDHFYPQIRIVSVDANVHTVTYAAGGVNSSLRSMHDSLMLNLEPRATEPTPLFF